MGKKRPNDTVLGSCFGCLFVWLVSFRKAGLFVCEDMRILEPSVINCDLRCGVLRRPNWVEAGGLGRERTPPAPPPGRTKERVYYRHFMGVAGRTAEDRLSSRRWR